MKNVRNLTFIFDTNIGDRTLTPSSLLPGAGDPRFAMTFIEEQEEVS
jgi:hypothetical protein